MKNLKFKIITLGCRTNQYESQAYMDQLTAMGYREALQGEEADMCIVNTCTVTESAAVSSRQKIRGLRRENPSAQLVVTGCLAESGLKEVSGIDLLVKNGEKEALLTHALPGEEIPLFAISSFSEHTRAFVKVQDGCNSFCTYCIIPYVRGRSRSRRLSDILAEIRGLIAQGYQEVVLTGINIGDFDGAPSEGEEPLRLEDLVRAVDQLPGLRRVRVSSIDPDEVDEGLLSAVVHGAKTCQSMHIVLQSGSNVILKKMNRKYTREMFLETVHKLKTASPDFTFTTDIIVGFPGESERDFQDTLEIMEQVQFAKVHMFPYSPRQRTRAASYPNRVAPEVIAQRKQQVLRLCEKIAFQLREGFVGKTMQVLLENDEKTIVDHIGGHTENFLPVYLPKEDCKPNTFVDVTITHNTPEGLIGKRCVLK